jgi:hypothetical protein
VVENSSSLTAWIYALGCGKIQVAQGMLKLMGSAGASIPVQFEKHVAAELRHGEALHQVIERGREELACGQYSSHESLMAQAMESYVRTVLGFVERQTVLAEAQYATAAQALGSRLLRHFAELEKQCGALELSQPLAEIIAEEARFLRTTQALFQSLPLETRSIYRGVRAFEELVFERMLRRLSYAPIQLERSALSCPLDRSGLARCV